MVLRSAMIFEYVLAYEFEKSYGIRQQNAVAPSKAVLLYRQRLQGQWKSYERVVPKLVYARIAAGCSRPRNLTLRPSSRSASYIRVREQLRAKSNMSAFVELTNGALYWTLVGCVPQEKFILLSPTVFSIQGGTHFPVKPHPGLHSTELRPSTEYPSPNG
jgi:hypothetical protein